MGDNWTSRGKENSPYNYDQIRAVLGEIGVYVVSETSTNFLCYCPYHGNGDTAAFSINFSSGQWMCFNPACAEVGNIFKLMRFMIKCNDFEGTRLLQKFGIATQVSFEDRLAATEKSKDEWTEWRPDLIQMYKNDMFMYDEGRDYMNGRGFTDDTLREFEVGYSNSKRMVTVPVHSPNGLAVGIVGRSIEGKEFKNSTRLPNTRTLFNYHRAKRAGEICVVTESSFDTMRVSQAGYTNVVGTLGGYMSPDRYALLDRTFNMIIIMTDDDKPQMYKDCRKCLPLKCQGHNPGKELGLAIANTLRNKNVMWASYDTKMRFPHGAKDAGDMTDNEIRHCIENSVSHLEFMSWGL